MSENTTAKQDLPRKLGLIVFPGFEPLDAFGPIEAFQTLSWRTKFDLVVIGPTLDPISTGPPDRSMIKTNSVFELRIVPTHTFDNAPEDIDVLLVPGGLGAVVPHEAAVAFIKNRYPKLKYLITVCNGAALAAKSGVLDGRRATTNKAFWKLVTEWGPNVNWVKTARFVVDGNVWTASGVSAGIDTALAWIAHVFGEPLARNCANTMEYEWKNDPNWDPFAYMFSEEKVEVTL